MDACGQGVIGRKLDNKRISGEGCWIRRGRSNSKGEKEVKGEKEKRVVCAEEAETKAMG